MKPCARVFLLKNLSLEFVDRDSPFSHYDPDKKIHQNEFSEIP